MTDAAKAFGRGDVAALKQAAMLVHGTRRDVRPPLVSAEPEIGIRVRYAFSPLVANDATAA